MRCNLNLHQGFSFGSENWPMTSIRCNRCASTSTVVFNKHIIVIQSSGGGTPRRYFNRHRTMVHCDAWHGFDISCLNISHAVKPVLSTSQTPVLSIAASSEWEVVPVCFSPNLIVALVLVFNGIAFLVEKSMSD